MVLEYSRRVSTIRAVMRMRNTLAVWSNLGETKQLIGARIA